MARAAQGPLKRFDGKDVIAAATQIRKTGDGLSKAMAAEPQEFHHGDRVYVVIEAVVEKVRFDPVTDTDKLTRVHMLVADTSTFVDEDLVAAVLEEQRRKNDEHAGVHKLPIGEKPDGMSDEEWVASGGQGPQDDDEAGDDAAEA